MPGEFTSPEQMESKPEVCENCARFNDEDSTCERDE